MVVTTPMMVVVTTPMMMKKVQALQAIVSDNELEPGLPNAEE